MVYVMAAFLLFLCVAVFVSRRIRSQKKDLGSSDAGWYPNSHGGTHIDQADASVSIYGGSNYGEGFQMVTNHLEGFGSSHHQRPASTVPSVSLVNPDALSEFVRSDSSSTAGLYTDVMPVPLATPPWSQSAKGITYLPWLSPKTAAEPSVVPMTSRTTKLPWITPALDDPNPLPPAMTAMVVNQDFDPHAGGDQVSGPTESSSVTQQQQHGSP